jgi:iron complex outermembrane receptor protein
MDRKILLSLCASTILFGADSVPSQLEVIGNKLTQTIENISGEDLKSADLAEALSKESSSVSMIRRSGIANDILVRSQKKDNIAVDIDGCCIAGACPNRMDPPTSHIVTNNVDDVEITGGPFDVESFGVLSAKVSIKTKEPTKELSGDINANIGSYDYNKLSATVSGGNDKVRVLVGGSTEKGGQYEDGDGKTLSQQLDKEINNVTEYLKDAYTNKTMDAFEKKTGTVKVFVNPTDNTELRFGYMANRSDDILYPSSTMDAVYDDSNLYSFGATTKNLSNFSKELSLDIYKSDVQHLMSTRYRNYLNPTTNGYMDAYVETEMTGAKLKNKFDIANQKLTIGLDVSDRNWNGQKYFSLTQFTNAMTDANFIPDVDTKNRAIFAEDETSIGNAKIKIGARYDDTNIKANKIAKSMAGAVASGSFTNTTTADRDKDYNAFSANVLATIKANNNLEFIAGIGKSSRVPDAKELYMSGGNAVATGNLNQTQNREIDLGFDYKKGNFGLKAKAFYSDLKDYIYYKLESTAANSKYVNIDAHIYGVEANSFVYFTDEVSLDMGISYQRGKKDSTEAGTDEDLADIIPLKTNVAINYDNGVNKASFEMVARQGCDNIDSLNNEQKLSGWAVFNAKANHKFTKNIDLTVGVDNIFDKTYAATNTYADLSLAGDATKILINEPGRYAYANLRYKF